MWQLMSNKIIYKYYCTWKIIEKGIQNLHYYIVLYWYLSYKTLRIYMYVNVYEEYYEYFFRIKSTEFLNEIYMINVYSSITNLNDKLW